MRSFPKASAPWRIFGSADCSRRGPPPEELEENIFDIVNQFDRGAALITAAEEREQVAGLNLMAGKRAKAATAYASALQYFTAGRACWRRTDGNSATSSPSTSSSTGPSASI